MGDATAFGIASRDFANRNVIAPLPDAVSDARSFPILRGAGCLSSSALTFATTARTFLRERRPVRWRLFTVVAAMAAVCRKIAGVAKGPSFKAASRVAPGSHDAVPFTASRSRRGRALR